MSFALTTEQIRQQTKTVTRRMGWRFAEVGDVVQPVVKAQGLKKGERVEKIGGPIRFVSVRRERLWNITMDECAREGFPNLTPPEFCNMFTDANGCHPSDEVTRIEFSYVD